MKDACLENHGQILQIMMPYLSVSDPARHSDSLFWAAWFGNLEALQHLLTFLQNDQRALLLALAGAISGKASAAIVHLLKTAGVSPISEDVPTRFTDIARLLLSNNTSSIIAKPTEAPSASALVQRLHEAVRTGELIDVINISDAMQAYDPDLIHAFSSAAMNNHVDVLLFLCENWTPHMVASSVKSPAVAQIFIDFGWDMDQKNDNPQPLLG